MACVCQPCCKCSKARSVKIFNAEALRIKVLSESQTWSLPRDTNCVRFGSITGTAVGSSFSCVDAFQRREIGAVAESCWQGPCLEM